MILYLRMMEMALITVGRTDAGWVKEGLDMYVSRLGRYIQFSMLEIPYLKKSQSIPHDKVKEMEGELILKAIKPSDEVVLLDERGSGLRSVELASFLGGRMASSVKRLVFVIGGAYGFSGAVYSRADSMLSLSNMTFPHQLVRVLFAEQLYRAFTILKGEPYHHE